MKLHIVRLEPGSDLRPALAALVSQRNIAAGFVMSAVGSLSDATLRFANDPVDWLIGGPLEIVSLSGTLCPDGCHLHVAVADAKGAVTGGHLVDGCFVRTTAEIVIGEAPGVSFRREKDAATGYRELVISEANPPST